jgi:hypothetical protein
MHRKTISFLHRAKTEIQSLKNKKPYPVGKLEINLKELKKGFYIILLFLNLIVLSLSCTKKDPNEIKIKYRVSYKTNQNGRIITINLKKSQNRIISKYFFVRNGKLYEALFIKENPLDFESKERPRVEVLDLFDIKYTRYVDYFDLIGLDKNQRNDAQILDTWDYFFEENTHGYILIKRGSELNKSFEYYKFDKNYKVEDVYFGLY